jgi:hypothetical protein
MPNWAERLSREYGAGEQRVFATFKEFQGESSE